MAKAKEITRRDFLTLGIKPTHKHKKGGLYEHACRAIATDKIITGETVVVYVNEAGAVFVRPARLFDEKDRFEPIQGEKWEQG